MHSVLDMMRQYEALRSLDYVNDNLKSAIFCRPSSITVHSKKLTNPVPAPLKPSSVVSQVWDKVTKQTNQYQLSAIEKIASGRAKENIALLQGPPGK